MSIRTNVERLIEQWDGTAIGQDIKNMYENGTNFESICDYANIPFEGDEEEH